MGTRRQQQRERGASLVEFTFVALLLFGLVFGIVGFGVVLSFKQTMTQAANEGARAAAVTADLASTAAVDERVEAAKTSVQAFEGWGRSCGSGVDDVDCSGITVHDCGSTTQTSALPDCITVRLEYDYQAAPIVPNLPLMSAFMPDSVESSATSQLTYSAPVGP